MRESNWRELCAYMTSLWGRELTYAQKAAGLKLLSSISDEAVEGAVVAIAESGREQLPPWPLVLKTARSLEEAMRAHLPGLPQGDTLSDAEHAAAMMRLRAKQTPEQRRRADRMTSETKGLPMKVQLNLAGELLRENQRVDAGSWDLLFEARVSEEAGKLEVKR